MEREMTPMMRGVMLNNLLTFVKGANIEGKIQYMEINGLTQLIRWCCREGAEEKEMYGEGEQLWSIRLKLLQLVNDLVRNDDSIIDDGFYVRKSLGNDD